MWTILIGLSVVTIARSENIGGWDRQMSDGVTSLGYKVLYADEDYTIVNEVVSKEDKRQALKHKEKLKDTIKPLPSEDLKCLISVDKHCSKSMGEMKSVLIQAVKEDCAKCTDHQKEEAGKVIASLMAHDPTAWKLFLTRTIIMLRDNDHTPKKGRQKREKPKFEQVGEPEEVMPSKHMRRVYPGATVKVTRTRMRKIN
ncbi:insect pheromone-binding family, a10/OS-D domain-containing protein [Phthorimaea operculella]|nr:insect pheromone-binding family, a10/OS-D domain-containing protein [Phthorimaea operculella]